MSGYVFAFSACYACQTGFSYNPNKVPSIRINGVREPICRRCVELVNPRRVANGLPEIAIDPEAYEPCPEEELE